MRVGSPYFLGLISSGWKHAGELWGTPASWLWRLAHVFAGAGTPCDSRPVTLVSKLTSSQASYSVQSARPAVHGADFKALTPREMERPLSFFSGNFTK